MRKFLLWCYRDWARAPISGTACLALFTMTFCEFTWGDNNIGWHALILGAIFSAQRGPMEDEE